MKQSTLFGSSWLLAILALGFLGLLSCVSAAQQPADLPAASSTLVGAVIDRDGSVCEGAHVQLRSPGVLPRTSISGADGQFSFAKVPAGGFVITVSAIGFASQTVRGSMASGAILSLAPVVLRPTSTSEVRVSGDPAEVAIEELHAEEKQRVLGVVPNFEVIYDYHAPPLSSRQKYQLAAHTLVDPYTVLIDGGTAGFYQAEGDFKDFGNGPAGYMRRFGVVYGDDVVGTMLGGAVLPSLLHQDPRYFYKGTGSKTSRALYAIASSVLCKGDNGRRQFNYSSISAGFVAASISEAYYPPNNRNSGLEIVENVGVGVAAAAVQNLFQEFIARHFTRKVPTYTYTNTK